MSDLKNVTTQEQVQTMLSAPAGKPPSGATANLDNPQNLDGPVILTIVFFLIVAASATSMRVYTKAFIIRSLRYEDYAIFLGWLFFVADCVTFWLTLVHGGHGIRIWNLRLRTVFKLLHWFNAAAIIYTPAEFLIRYSILMQYIRIFVPNRRAARAMFYSTHVLIWCNGIFYLAKFIGLMALCVPRKKLWEPWTRGGHCSSANAWFIASGVFNVVMDFAILILPVRSIWELRLPKAKKIMMVAIFATGGLACVASIFRTLYSFRIALEPDVTFNIIVMGCGAVAELGTGVVVSCLPVLPRFFQHFWPKLTRQFSRLTGPDTNTNPFSDGTDRRESSPQKHLPAHDQPDSWSRSTPSPLKEGTDVFEHDIQGKYAMRELLSPVPFERLMSDKSLPPTPDARA